MTHKYNYDTSLYDGGGWMLSVFPAQTGATPAAGGGAASGGTIALRGAVRAACRALCEEEDDSCTAVTVDFAPAAPDDDHQAGGWIDLGEGWCKNADGLTLSHTCFVAAEGWQHVYSAEAAFKAATDVDYSYEYSTDE
eukprot:gene16993-14923_t